MSKKILEKDKQIILAKRAMGYSHQDAIEGTMVNSKATSWALEKNNIETVKDLRAKYLKLIENNGAGLQNRAMLWAEMAVATKTVSAVNTGKNAGADSNDFIEVPDWLSREKALKYIDKMAEINIETDKDTPANQFNYFSFTDQVKDDFNTKFIEFLSKDDKKK